MSLAGIYILFGGILLAFLSSLTWNDFKTFRLPDNLTLPLIPLGILQAYLLTSNFIANVIGTIIGYLVFVIIEYAFKTLRGIDGLGRGDAKLLAAGGAWCGWSNLPFIVLIASSIGIVLAMSPKYKALGRIPFGPFLAFGIFIVWTAGAHVALGR